VYMYVDDSATVSGVTSAKDVIDEIKEELQWKYKNNEGQELSRFVGSTHVVTEDGIHISQEYLAASLPVTLIEGEKFPRCGPFTAGAQEDYEQRIELETQQGRLLNTTQHAKYRTILGSLSFLQATRPDLQFAIHFASRFMSAPTRSAMEILLRCARYAKLTARLGIIISTRGGKRKNNMEFLQRSGKEGDGPSVLGHHSEFPIKKWHIDVLADAANGTRATAGYLIFLNGNLVAARSFAPTRVVNSSTKGEILAMYEASDVGRISLHMLRALGEDAADISFHVWTDSNDVVRAMGSVIPTGTEVSSGQTYGTTRGVIDGTASVRNPTAHMPSEITGRDDIQIGNPGPEDMHGEAPFVGMGAYLPNGIFDAAWFKMVTAMGHVPNQLMAQSWFAPDLDDAAKKREAHNTWPLMLSTCQKLHDTRGTLFHIAGINMLADAMTKGYPTMALRDHIMHTELEFRTGKEDEQIEAVYSSARKSVNTVATPKPRRTKKQKLKAQEMLDETLRTVADTQTAAPDTTDAVVVHRAQDTAVASLEVASSDEPCM
jgi:hypothetical protein